jgi:Xaa-Pro aminopeptidase
MNYQGDTALAALLAKAGSAYDVAGVRALVAGILAAPTPKTNADAWMALVAPMPSPALGAQLAALKAETAQAWDTGLGPGDWTANRLDTFRAGLVRSGLSGFVLPRGDEHQGEYVAPRSERLAWLTGFTGSAGLAIILKDRAAIFVDGRYTLQVRNQTDQTLFEPRHLVDEPPAEWLAKAVRRGDRIGYDPWLHTADALHRLREACTQAEAELVAVQRNPVDAVWSNQPPPPLAPVFAYGIEFAGRDSAAKRTELAARLMADGYAAAVIAAPDAIAWLLNIRGGDVPHTPLPLSFAVLHADGQVDLFIDPRKLMPSLNTHLGNAVRVAPPAELGAALDALGRAKARVLVDTTNAACWISERLEHAGARIGRGQDPCALPKACKNAVELDNIRAAHRRDGAALTRFLAWLAGEAPKGRLTELDAARRLLKFRRSGERFRDLSFSTISGAGANGAIVHYRVTAETSRPIELGTLYLVDSGAQYLDGTTDVTRTVAIGAPTAEQRDRFTRVLKGHIALATARFPKGTSGSQLDALARRALWEIGLDFDHGTGHGVGSYLSVHEGPHRISKAPNTVALQPGMIVSDEPGYYKTGAYGIRIENLIAVRELEAPAGAERPLLGFEVLTLAPIDRALVEPALMTASETAWFDAYHTRVRETLTPLVDEATAAWLAAATRPMGG